MGFRRPGEGGDPKANPLPGRVAAEHGKGACYRGLTRPVKVWREEIHNLHTREGRAQQKRLREKIRIVVRARVVRPILERVGPRSGVSTGVMPSPIGRLARSLQLV
jgi:hypothetical protein